MAYSVTNLGTNANGIGGTLTVTLGVSVAAGSIVIVAVEENTNNTGAGTVTDTGTHTYTSIIGASPNGSSANGFAQIFYSPNISMNNGDVVTYNKVGTGQTEMSVCYITGARTASPLDTACNASATGTSTTPSVTSGTPSTAGSLLVGAIGANSNPSTITQDSGHGWATPPNSSSGNRISGGNVTTSSSTIYAPTFNMSSTWAALVTGFKPAVFASPPHQNRKIFYRNY